MRRLSAVLVITGLAAGMMASAPLHAQVGEPKNVKVLKGKSTKEIREYMKTFTAGLGVKCDFCHNLKDYSSDEKDKKRIGREFLIFMNTINQQVATINRTTMKKAKLDQVTCYTCHHGQLEIVSKAPATKDEE